MLFLSRVVYLAIWNWNYFNLTIILHKLCKEGCFTFEYRNTIPQETTVLHSSQKSTIEAVTTVTIMGRWNHYPTKRQYCDLYAMVSHKRVDGGCGTDIQEVGQQFWTNVGKQHQSWSFHFWGKTVSLLKLESLSSMVRAKTNYNVCWKPWNESNKVWNGQLKSCLQCFSLKGTVGWLLET